MTSLCLGDETVIDTSFSRGGGRRETALSSLAKRLGLLTLIEWEESARPNILRVLAYHRIGHFQEALGRHDPSLVSATPEEFDAQMAYLARNYHVLSLEELLAAQPSRQPLPPRSVLITFDDGYRDFLERAWPVLQRYSLPSVLFVATDFLDGDGRLYWWDSLYGAVFQTDHPMLSLPPYGYWPLHSKHERNRAFAQLKRIVERTDHHRAMDLVSEIQKQLGVKIPQDDVILSWKDVSHLSRNNVYIGAHTRSHPVLSRLPLGEAVEEIIGSQTALRRELGHTWPVLAFPLGHAIHLRPDLASSIEEAGFRFAVTMIEGHNMLGKSAPLQLRRLAMAPNLSIADFRLALTGVYDIYGTLKRLHQSLR